MHASMSICFPPHIINYLYLPREIFKRKFKKSAHSYKTHCRSPRETESMAERNIRYTSPKANHPLNILSDISEKSSLSSLQLNCY